MLLTLAFRCVFASLLIVLSLLNRAPAQCRGGNCGGGSASPPAIVNWGPPAATSAYSWQLRTDGDWELHYGLNWAGYYSSANGLYYPWTGFGYAVPSSRCPVSLPESVTRWQRPGLVGWQTTGVSAGEIATTERTTFVGTERAKCAEAPVGPDRLPDISGQYRITPIGTPEECAAIEQDWQAHPALAPFKSAAILKSYRPNDPAVADRGFYTAGHPTISVEAPDATEVRLLQSYPGPVAFAGYLAGDLRQPNPNYNPTASPGPAGVGLPGGLSPELAVGLGLIVIVGGLAFYYHRAAAGGDDPALEGVLA